MERELTTEELALWQDITEFHLEQYYMSEQGSEVEVGTFSLHDATSSIRRVLAQSLLGVANNTSLQIIFEQDLNYQVSTFFGLGNNNSTASTEENGISATVLQGFILDPFQLGIPQRAYVKRLQQNASSGVFDALTTLAVSSFEQGVPETNPPVTSSSNTTASNIFVSTGNSTMATSPAGNT